MMDTGDGGHSAWFQSRVQVLVRSLRAHQAGSLSPQCGDRPKEEEEQSTSSQPPPPPPPPPRRPLQLGRSLANRWQQYSPGPLRRLRKFFSVTSEQEQNDDWDSEGDDARKDQLVTAAVGKNHSSGVPLPSESPVITGSKDGGVFGRVTEPQQDNGSVTEHQRALSKERPDTCSQNLENKSISDSGNASVHSHPDPSYNKENGRHSGTLIPLTEDLYITQYGTQESAVCIPGISDTDDSIDGADNTSTQKHFNKEFYVLTAASEDEDDKECWQQGAMTQWRRTDNDAGTVKGRATIVQGGTHDCDVIPKQLAPFQGLSGDVDTCHSEDELTFINRKLDEETPVLVKTETSEKRLSAVLPVDGSGDTTNAVVNCNMAQNADEKRLKLEAGACDRGGDTVPVTEPDMATSLAVSDVDEPDLSVLSLPSIVLELPRTSDNPPDTSDVTISDIGPHRHPKLQLQISTNCSQSPARKSPVTVQEWVDSLPLHHRTEEEGGEDPPLEESDDHLGLGLGAEAGLLYNALPAVTVVSPAEPHPDISSVSKVTAAAHLARESSVQSDVTSHTGSHCSSVESYLESRRPDPEEILLSLGFGGPVGGASGVDNEVSRIPRRFLQPSKVKGVAIDSFLRYQQDLIETFESGFCGYRGLTGNTVDVLKFEQQFTSSAHIKSSLSSPVRTFAPISPILSNSLANVPARFLPQTTLGPRQLLAVPGTENPFLSTNMLRSHSTRRHLSVKVHQTRRASEPGPSHTVPSEIVAKIIEKLRERERENIPPPSVASAPVIGNNETSSPSLPTASSKFSRAARHVLTRTTVLGALPFIARQQQQQQSVLTPDNRRFLDSQGSRSPEIPRKRMIIGHRSYTFDCDGDLIEVEPVSPPSSTTNLTPKPKPLVHKDSVLSTTTSLSFTSIDSDSDTDDHGRGFAVQPRHNIAHDRPVASFPKSTHFPSANLSQHSRFDQSVTQKVYPMYPITNKRMSSTSVSSWESEGVVSPILPCSDAGFGVEHQCTEECAAEHTEEELNDGALKVTAKHYNRFHSSPDSPLSVFWPMRYESIDEDVEVKSDKSAGLLSTSASEQSQDVPCETDADRQVHHHDRTQEQYTDMNNGYKTETKDTAPHVHCESESSNRGVVGQTAESDSDVGNFSGPPDAQKSTKTIEEQMQIQRDVISLLQIRRGSLKRQQRILDDDEDLEVLDKDNSEVLKEHDSVCGVIHKETQPLALVADVEESTPDVKESTQQECVCDSYVFTDDTSPLENSRIQDLRSHEIHCVGNEDAEGQMQEHHRVEILQKGNTGLHLTVEELSGSLDFTKGKTEAEVQLTCGQKIEEPQNRDLLQVANADTGGDSFEMEEICTCGEEEGRMTVLSRAWSGSSGFLDGDCEMYLPKQNGHSVEGTTKNSESSQQGGVSITSNEIEQVPSNTEETMPDGNAKMTNVPSCTSNDILQHDSDLVSSANFGNEKLKAIECPTDFSVTRNTIKCVRRREIGPGAINQQNLPNSLFQELSSVNDWLDQRKAPFGVQPVCDLDSSRAVLHQRSLLENASIRANDGRSSFIANRYNAEEATAHNFPFSNKAVTCGKSAIPPRIHNFTRVYQDSSLGHLILPNQSSLLTDDDSESTRHRTMSLHSIDHKNGSPFGAVRRVRSAPHCLEHLASGDMYGSSWSSVSNMFSFCSDESVIHVGLQKAGLGRTSEKQLSDMCANTLFKPVAMNSCDNDLSDGDTNSGKHVTNTTCSTQHVKPCVIPCGRNSKRSLSDAAVTGLHQLIGELADRGWDITMGTDPSHFACHTDQQLLHLQGDAVRAGLAAYGRQLVGGQGSEQNSDHEVAEANKELQTIKEVRDRIAAELRHIADLLEEQPPHRAASITGQMAVLLREQTRLCQQLEALNFESSPSIYVEPASCCSVRDAVRQENRQLQNIVERNSQELKEIRQLLMELVSLKNSQY